MLTTTLSTFETDTGKIPVLIISQPDIDSCKTTLVISKCSNIVCFISLAVLLNITPMIHTKQAFFILTPLEISVWISQTHCEHWGIMNRECPEMIFRKL